MVDKPSSNPDHADGRALPWLRVVSAPHPSRQPVDDFLRDCQLTMTRRGGPGGQHRNKTSTAVVLLHQPTGVLGEGSESRSQAANRANAVARLRTTLAVVVRCRPGEGPLGEQDAALREKHRGRNVWVSERNEQRPAVLSLILDDAWTAEGELPVVAQRWQTTASQLLKVLRSHPPALDYLNRMRASWNLRPLR
ncbi:peptide chain release factor family protein [Roseimaritima ulvae]|uniref:Peptide chain release factor 1 n=1 Tax=Roseimaritima ulvae TaxID=980254 RepID=A0A5B9QN51_9BACT|nr:peptide chain release factor-like protein [Roseimaritima ulvae]QEG39449.1 Peptide chain release factor 1 [Roseimaritima ulvae]